VIVANAFAANVILSCNASGVPVAAVITFGAPPNEAETVNAAALGVELTKYVVPVTSVPKLALNDTG